MSSPFPQYEPQPQPQPPRRLTRSTTDTQLTGVCGGLAAYFNLDPTLVRVLTVLVGIFTFPAGLIGYVVLAAVMPKDDTRAY